ncbi:LPXTG cell wall anchor domain-containing protein [Streptomyces sp. NBC_00820]|uniref:LAETG motif-containing sortase-dependent surface protein n=1 Tax=Streptomyces sp. NBC_00820 TaxID=2975842 RepID=UPI002ED38698|nr:LPXTG cell wall anchor domain-containing protein [Streptomyces sp. NBC_00820]
MSITRRNARRSVRILGVASATAALAIGVAGTASACNIRDFKAEASCAGDKGQIVVTDIDGSSTPATITVFEKTAAGNETQVAQKEGVKGSREGTRITFDVDWKASTAYRIHVKTDRFNVDNDISPELTTSSTACKKEESPTTSPTEDTKPTTPAPSASASVSDSSESPAPAESESSSAAPAGAASNAPSPAVGDSNLAETGANSNTGMIAGVAGALVVVGGGAVFFGMRRRGAKSAG